jgi:hypothetical protein
MLSVFFILFFIILQVDKLRTLEAERKDQEDSKQDTPIVFGKPITLYLPHMPPYTSHTCHPIPPTHTTQPHPTPRKDQEDSKQDTPIVFGKPLLPTPATHHPTPYHLLLTDQNCFNKKKGSQTSQYLVKVTCG